MNMNEFQTWVQEFYEKRGWTQYGPFIRVGFLMGEAGKIARRVKTGTKIILRKDQTII
ncbi:hypothetical protein EFBL_1637 [Effusibacillus lacus]|uniref:Uncharacterized protein n=1 Tax=Effusibacillus lacus TaxID=1348429 RepID=A0A292YM83_9BACL|nr:hypothetical protein EDD64_12931 [Effusibacillus lacus]GAX90011.1 hypothetical protein EFBL_1637 [Effusibacillus lacus]